jgi:hypothetical protein
MALTKVTTGTIADDSIQSLKNRNLIINGAMQVWQRNLTQTSTGYGCVDRWKNTVSGTTTFSQDTASLPTGFEYALRWTTGASSSYGQSRQYLETSTVKILRGRTLTASSYVKVSGSYSGYVTWEIAYSTISDSAAGNTWVQLTETSVVTASALDASSDYKRISCNVAIPSNAVGLYIGIVPSATQASGQWVSVTGVQLEVGEVATPFEHRSYGEELALCQRYYQKYTYIGLDGTSAGDGVVSRNYYIQPQMRSAPDINFGAYGFRSNTSMTTPYTTTIAPTNNYILFQVTGTANSRVYIYNPVYLSAEL